MLERAGDNHLLRQGRALQEEVEALGRNEVGVSNDARRSFQRVENQDWLKWALMMFEFEANVEMFTILGKTEVEVESVCDIENSRTYFINILLK